MRKSPDNPFVEAAASEVHRNPPAILARTRKKKGKAAAERQRVAIMLSKARRAEARKR